MLGLGTSLVKGGKVGRTYVKDGLKLYMPYRGSDASEVQFVGTGSTSFDGDNDYIDCGSGSTIDDVFAGGGTICTWINPSSDGETSYGRIASKALNNGWELYVSDESSGSCKVRYYTDFSSNDGRWDTDNTVITIGAWNHVAVTYDNGNVANNAVIYINGISVAVTEGSTPVGTRVDDSSQDLWIGDRNDSTKTFDGSIKNVAIWNRILTATEIQNVMYKTYAEVSGRLASGLVSWWALEESKSGDATKAVDSKGSNEGTISGATVAAYGAATLYGGDTPVKPRAIDNAPTVQADAIGAGSASFDGVDDYIALGISADDSNLTSGTITAWVKADVSPPSAIAPIISLQDPADASDVFLISVRGAVTNDPLQVMIKNNGSETLRSNYDNDTLAAGVWTHIAYTCDSSDGNALYVNGVLATATSGADPTETAAFLSQVTVRTNGFQIGSLAAESRWHDGNICQVGLWSAALTQAQIQSVMEKTYEEFTASEKTNLVSYWALDETIESSGEGASFVFDKVGGTLGSELITNGDFSSWSGGNPTGWSTVSGTVNEVGSDGSAGTGSAQLVNEGAQADLRANSVMTSGKTYKLTIDIKVVTSGDLRISDASGNFVSGLNSTGIKTYYRVVTGTQLQIIASTNPTDIVIDDISLKEVQGNPGALI